MPYRVASKCTCRLCTAAMPDASKSVNCLGAQMSVIDSSSENQALMSSSDPFYHFRESLEERCGSFTGISEALGDGDKKNLRPSQTFVSTLLYYYAIITSPVLLYDANTSLINGNLIIIYENRRISAKIVDTITQYRSLQVPFHFNSSHTL